MLVKIFNISSYKNFYSSTKVETGYPMDRGYFPIEMTVLCVCMYINVCETHDILVPKDLNLKTCFMLDFVCCSMILLPPVRSNHCRLCHVWLFLA